MLLSYFKSFGLSNFKNFNNTIFLRHFFIFKSLEIFQVKKRPSASRYFQWLAFQHQPPYLQIYSFFFEMAQSHVLFPRDTPFSESDRKKGIPRFSRILPRETLTEAKFSFCIIIATLFKSKKPFLSHIGLFVIQAQRWIQSDQNMMKRQLSEIPMN